MSRHAWYWNIYYRPVIVVSDMAGGGFFFLSIGPDNSECCMYTFAVSLSSWQPIHWMALSYIRKIRGSTSDGDCDASTISQTSDRTLFRILNMNVSCCWHKQIY